MKNTVPLTRLLLCLPFLLLLACGGGGGSSNNSTAPDSDADGVADANDNCPNTVNVGQEDLDSDGTGDACDDDIDGDGTANTDDIDEDNDGLIEIATLEQLDWMRNDLAGTTLEDNTGKIQMDGCPTTGCNGYELIADLDFDTNGDGTMDAGDSYFDYDNDGGNNGWLPIGNQANRFTANLQRQ